MKVDTADIRRWLAALTNCLNERQDLLDDLDSGAGDGDHGATMVMGFRRVQQIVDANYDTPAQLLKAAGQAFAGVGGSIGPLWGMGLLRASQSLPDRSAIDGRHIASALVAAAAGAAEIGGARPGDRTLLDAAAPAADAFAASIAAGSSDAGNAGWLASLDGAAATTTMRASRGRAARNPALAAGKVDPGCASVALAWTVAVSPTQQQRWLEVVTRISAGGERAAHAKEPNATPIAPNVSTPESDTPTRGQPQ